MAAAVVGLSYRERWNSTSGPPSGGAALHLRSDRTMGPNGFAGGHASHEGLDDPARRPRLPSISNFLQSTGHLEMNGRPRFEEPTTTTMTNIGYPPSVPPPRPISSPSASHNPWSPQDDLRQKSQFDQRPPFHVRSSSDAHFSDHGHRLSLVPPIAGPDTRASHPLTAPGADAGGPNARATAKRVVREEVVNGKGLCYVYDDGSVCQKIINGDTVNPKWGTTKAGKPRKRLGQACNTCREKKIKCDPSFPKCTQCQKFNRECRFDPTCVWRPRPPSPAAPRVRLLTDDRTRSTPKSPKMRGAAVSPSDDAAGEDGSPYLRRPSAAPTEGSTHSDAGVQGTPRYAYSEDERVAAAHPGEGSHRKGTEVSTPSKRARPTESPLEGLTAPNKRNPDGTHPGQNPPPRQPFALLTDPYAVDPGLTRACLDIYFGHSLALKHNLVPRSAFITWMERDDHKSADSILVLYAMLAWACALDATGDRGKLGIIFDEIVLEGLTPANDHFTLQRIQARAIFTIQSFQVGHFERAWSMCGAAIHTACAMKLYTEDGIDTRCREGPGAYHLDPVRLAESMRRSFWCVYQLDRIGVSCLCWGSPFNKSEICLRIPCVEEAFESGHVPRCPVYDGEDGLLSCPGDDLVAAHGTLVRRMQILTLLGDVQHMAFRSRLQTIANLAARMAGKRRDLQQKLLGWHRGYTADLRKDASSLLPVTSTQASEVGGLHVMYHNACMSLHRHIHHTHLTQSEIAEHLREAYYHASRTLEIAAQLVSHGNTDICDYHIAADDPTTGYAVLTAIDIVTSAGIISDLLEDKSRLMTLILPGIELIDRLARRWVSAKNQQVLLTERLKFLLRAAQGGVVGGKVAFYITEPMATSYGRDNDVVYGTDRLRYLRTVGLGAGVRTDADLLPVYIRRDHR